MPAGIFPLAYIVVPLDKAPLTVRIGANKNEGARTVNPDPFYPAIDRELRRGKRAHNCPESYGFVRLRQAALAHIEEAVMASKKRIIDAKADQDGDITHVLFQGNSRFTSVETAIPMADRNEIAYMAAPHLT